MFTPMNSPSNLRSHLFHGGPGHPSACTSKDGKSGKETAMWFDCFAICRFALNFPIERFQLSTKTYRRLCWEQLQNTPLKSRRGERASRLRVKFLRWLDQ